MPAEVQETLPLLGHHTLAKKGGMFRRKPDVRSGTCGNDEAIATALRRRPYRMSDVGVRQDALAG